jgi:hypothetical protein
MPDGGITPFRGEKNTNWEGGFRVPAIVRWPGHIELGSVTNEIVSHQDWVPTLMAAVGDPDIKEKLLEGHTAGNRTYKVHLDGHNILELLTGKTDKSLRDKFFYVSDDGQLLAVRTGDWKVVFAEQRARRFDVWRDPFVELRAPKVFHLSPWGFQNVQHFQPTAMLDNGSGAPVPWQMDVQNLDRLAIQTPDNESFELRRLMEMYNTDAFFVVHDGRIVYERYWNDITTQTPHWLASTSKSVIGTAAAILVDRGVLDRERLVKTYIPELAESGFAEATVGQLLDMTAGTAWDESMEELVNPESFARQYGAAAGSVMVLLFPR